MKHLYWNEKTRDMSAVETSSKDETGTIGQKARTAAPVYNDADEKENVVECIKKLLADGVSPEEIAVVAYTKEELIKLSELCVKNGIDVICVSPLPAYSDQAWSERPERPCHREGKNSSSYHGVTCGKDRRRIFAEESGPDEDLSAMQNKIWKGAHLVAYTDGSYNQNTMSFGAGVVMMEKGSSDPPALYMKDGVAPAGENGWQVNGEVAAAEMAIEEAVKAGAASLDIFYDYEGIGKWADGKWKTNKTYTKKYAQFVRKSREILAIGFFHVKGHSGDRFNDMADSLAKKACGLL